MPLHARILLFDGFDELDAIAPYEVLMNGLRGGAEGDVAYVTLEGAARGHGESRDDRAGERRARRRRDAARRSRRRLERPLADGRARRGRAGEIPAAIAAAHARGATIASVCTGGMLVAAAGLLKGRPAVTHHGALEDLAAAGARSSTRAWSTTGTSSARAA